MITTALLFCALTAASDDARTTFKGSWDLVCDASSWVASRTSLALASSGGQLGALVTTTSTTELYICDIPSL